ncbi:MAG: dTMP kinase [Thermodesulfobacteriota bacterium]
MFITFEGIEGCGKSTQMGLLKEYLLQKGQSVLTLREPGGTLLGESVRSMLLTVGEEEISPEAELFLYEACRAQLVVNVIRPALKKGEVVLCDRFTHSTLAYQGYGRGLDLRAIRSMNETASCGLTPDITILLDIEVESGLSRAWSRISAEEGVKEDRFEREDMKFHEKVRKGFLEIAAQEEQVRIVNGRGKIHSIHEDICVIIDEMTL